MPAQIKKTVKPSGGDYSTLQAAIAAQAQDLVAGDKYLDIEIDGDWSGGADTSPVSVTGYTTDATHYINIYTTAQARHRGYWDTSAYRIDINTPYDAALSVGSNGSKFLRITGIQLRQSHTNDDAATLGLGYGDPVAASDIRFDKLIVIGTDRPCRFWEESSIITITNSVFIGSGNATDDPVIINLSHNLTMSNCVIRQNSPNCGGYGAAGGAVAIIKNCYASTYNSTAWTPATFTTCASDDGSESTAVAAYSTSSGARFTSTTSGSENFHITNTASSLYQAGTDLSASFTTDIDGTTRSGTWDIGIDYITSSSSSSSSSCRSSSSSSSCSSSSSSSSCRSSSSSSCSSSSSSRSSSSSSRSSSSSCSSSSSAYPFSGLFPTTGIIDNFNRSDNSGPPSTSWDRDGVNSFKIVSNQAKSDGLVPDAFAYNIWNPTSYGPDTEIYATIITKPANGFSFALHAINYYTDGNGYRLSLLAGAITDTITLSREDAYVPSQLGAAYTSLAVANGDSIGFSKVGSLLTVYHKPSAGSWTLLFTRTDSTYTGTKYFAMETDDTAMILDNFGGGTPVPSSSSSSSSSCRSSSSSSSSYSSSSSCRSSSSSSSSSNQSSSSSCRSSSSSSSQPSSSSSCRSSSSSSRSSSSSCSSSSSSSKSSSSSRSSSSSSSFRSSSSSSSYRFISQSSSSSCRSSSSSSSMVARTIRWIDRDDSNVVQGVHSSSSSSFSRSSSSCSSSSSSRSSSSSSKSSSSSSSLSRSSSSSSRSSSSSSSSRFSSSSSSSSKRSSSSSSCRSSSSSCSCSSSSCCSSSSSSSRFVSSSSSSSSCRSSSSSSSSSSCRSSSSSSSSRSSSSSCSSSSSHLPTQTTVVFQQGLNGYTGAQNCIVNPTFPNQEQTGYLRVRSDSAGYFSLLYFDLTSLSQFATIVSATLTLNIVDVFEPGGQIIVGRLLNPDNSAPWTDIGVANDVFSQKATFRYKVEETPVKWSVAGAQGNILDVLGATEDSFNPVQNQPVSHDFNVKSMVSAWVANELTNAGLYVKTGATNPNCTMNDKYNATQSVRPKLTIVYNPDGSSSSSCRSSSSSSRSSSSSSSSCRSSSSSCRSSSSSSRSSSSSSSSCRSSSSISSSSSCRSSSSSSRSSSSSSSSISTFRATLFTSGDLGDLPIDDQSLVYSFSTSDYTAVATDNGVYVATDGLNEFVIVMFKNVVTPGLPFTVTWNGKTNIAPTTSTVFMQLLNRTTNAWETLASNNGAAANVDFTLTATKSSGMANYLDVNNQIACRVYQELIYD